MSKATACKEALAKWEEKTGLKAAEAEEVKLFGQLPPIEKMDNTLSSLTNCKHLALSTNSIERIGSLAGLNKLEILSLGRNGIKKLEGLEPVAGTLTQLWISYNMIDKLAGIGALKKLKVLYMSNNKIDKWSEFEKLCDLPELEDLLLIGNPLEEKHTKDGNWRGEVVKRLPKLKKLDGKPVDDDDREAAGLGTE
eukprot:GFYU01001142.1.p1 GENE.GFYU01001142.1~~GFYU01001142.1.p1  ORF type:complete len:195 (-),score=59.80 GFYU01001142.1:446-1030(-)